MKSIKFVSILAVAAMAAPVAFAETGAGVVRIDYVANVYGRVGGPSVNVAGSVVHTARNADVNKDIRFTAPQVGSERILSAEKSVESVLGRS